VEIVKVVARDVPIYQQWIGTLEGYPNAQIRAQVTGYLMKQGYKEGSTVKQGDLLFQIDPRPFQAALDQAKAKELQDEAMVGKTELDVKRYTPLAKNQAISQEQLDDAIQANLSARASVEADKAAVENAQLNLGFTKITSPVDGVAGVATAQIGDLLGPSTGALTTVSTVNPIRVYFNISEQFYLTSFRPLAKDADGTGARDDIPLDLFLSDGSRYPSKGRWIFTGREVDMSTGTLQVAGEFDNPGNVLRPGQYGLVQACIATRRGALLVPQRAVTELQGHWQVAVVDATNTVQIRRVEVGEQIGSDWLINKGLAAGEDVVAEGTLKIRDGAVVEPEPYTPTQADKESTPGTVTAENKG
jgi:membrane fusion protein (multidrug efflux system)